MRYWISKTSVGRPLPFWQYSRHSGVSTIHKFQLSNLQLTDALAIFNITVPLKQSKPSRKPQPVIFHQYPHNEQLCPVRLVQVYLGQRKSLSVAKPSDAFFLTHRRPHHPASKDTIARWVKTVLHLSGVNIDIYKPHSCRSRGCLMGWSMEILGLFHQIVW